MKTCTFYIARKKRYCHFQITDSNSNLCRFHTEQQKPILICPFNPGHKVVESNYEKVF